MIRNSVEVLPLSGALGAKIRGVDLGEPMDEATFETIRCAFLEHLVIFFHDQQLDVAQLDHFARRWGEPNTHRYLEGMPGYAHVLEITREPDDPYVFAEGWHADVTYQERPVLGSMLYALEVPEVGGDTLFANQYLAYESLSSGMRAMLDELHAVHGSARVYADDEVDRLSYPDRLKVDIEQARSAETVHPVIRTHPETGRRALFVNDHYTLRFRDMSAEESRALLQFLLEHAIRPEFTCRFRWRQGSLAFWDNRCTLHSPIDDYFGTRRAMLRITVQGDRPR